MGGARLVPLGKGWAIEEVARAFGVGLDAKAEDALRSWLDLLVTWNAKLDLTAARSTDELLDLMLADAFFMAKRIARGASVVDVGTGAGAPGLALAIARPDLRVTLVEPLAKRVSFLRTAIGAIKRPEIAVERRRGEELCEAEPSFDVAISRATLAPAAWLALANRLAKTEAWVLLAKEDAPAAAEGARLSHGELLAYTWPRTGVARKAYVARAAAAVSLAT